MKKLILNKETIASLSNEDASKVKGGTQHGTRVSCQSNWGCTPCLDRCATCPLYSTHDNPAQLVNDVRQQCVNCNR